MSNPVGRPKQMIGVKVDATTKQQLEQLAAAEGSDLAGYLRRHYYELVQQGRITPEEDIRIPNPGYNPYPPYPPTPAGQPVPQYYYQQPAYYPPYAPAPFATQPTAPDQLDLFVAEMRKLMLAQMMGKMMMQMQGGNTTDVEALVRAYKGDHDGGKKEDFGMQDMMKWQMMQNMQDRNYQQQMQSYNQQLEAARGKGDKAGENQALQLITALATTQAQQSQNNMQQMMAMMQMANNTQQTLFTTALSTNQQAQESQRQERNQFQAQVSTVQNALNQATLQGVQNTSNLQIGFLTTEMERIRNDPKKDPITQLIELDALRKQSPILDAAFKGAFGIKEGGIGDWIPKLKELGIDKVIDKVTSALPTIIGGLMGARQQPIPIPTPETAQQPIPGIPGPLPAPTAEQLAALQGAHLPQGPLPQPPMETIPIEKPESSVQERPDNVGYTNLDVPKPAEPTQPLEEETFQIPAPEEPQSQDEHKTFTTGRKPKKQPTQ